MIRNTFLFILFIISMLGYGQKTVKFSDFKLDSLFGKYDETFVLYNLKNDAYQIYNKERAEQAYSVHSTSKLFWSIIGLEEGLIESENDIVKWDSTMYPPKKWWPKTFAQDQSVVNALRHSVNWYYFELLKLMNPEMINNYLDKLEYQKDFDVVKVHYFGLTFNIKRTALEQIEFLKNIYQNKFGLSEQTLKTIRKGMAYENTSDNRIFIRTGTGPISDDNNIGWYIGYVETETGTYFFAYNVLNSDESEVGKQRNEQAEQIVNTLTRLK